VPFAVVCKAKSFQRNRYQRAFEAAKMAGVSVARVDIAKDGKINIIPMSAVAG
jgi:hypothetical protein